MPSSSSYTVTHYPFTPPVTPDLVHRFKALRLEALHEAPASYHSNYAHESKFTDAQWISRLSDPKRHHLICRWIRSEDSHVDGATRDLEHQNEGDAWVGMFLLHGPLSNDDYMLSNRKGPPLGDDCSETRWHLVGLYLQPGHRGREASIAIHEGVLDFLRCWMDRDADVMVDERTGLEKARRARVIGTLGSEDPMLKGLYDSLGAYEVGRIGRVEALKIAGNLELIGGNEEDEGESGGEVGRKEIVVLEGVIEC